MSDIVVPISLFILIGMALSEISSLLKIMIINKTVRIMEDHARSVKLPDFGFEREPPYEFIGFVLVFLSAGLLISSFVFYHDGNEDMAAVAVCSFFVGAGIIGRYSIRSGVRPNIGKKQV